MQVLRILQDGAEVAVPQNIVNCPPNDTVSHLQKPESLSLTCLIQPLFVSVSSDFCLKEDCLKLALYCLIHCRYNCQ